ncbi:MAG: H(+)-transporting ATPase [Ruminococcaceae bacterium]|nr:H(+)-transporting ATPase [Oscillospiraceae bacterium]
MKKGKECHLKLTPARIIALGFAAVIFVGTFLLMLPVSQTGRTEIGFLDALFTSTSAVCVTGLSTIDVGWDLTTFGQLVMILLMQIGGLGITTIGIGVIAFSRRKITQRENLIVKEAINYPTLTGIGSMVKRMLILTLAIELVGGVLSYIVFREDYTVGRSLWLALFHTVASFNNAGFDIFGGGVSLLDYSGHLLMNFTTAFLVIAGGFGFFVMRDLFGKRSFKRYSLHTKVVISMTAILLAGGTVLIKLAQGSGMTWLQAFFASVTARTAGFSTYPNSDFTGAGALIMMILMFIGASPGSTGGGMKTTTFYVLIKSIIATATGKEAEGFRKKLPDEVLHKAFVIISLGMFALISVTIGLALLEPDIPLPDIMFETTSAIATVGLSTGITPVLSGGSKLLLILTMYVGRLGPMTIATMWAASRKADISHPEESLPVG